MTNTHFPIFDSHLHIFAPSFPLIPNQGYLPDYFTIEDYRTCTASLNIVGGAVVSASFQGFDQGYLLAVLKQLGSGFVGVAQLPEQVTDEEILQLHRAGVRAVRFNLYRGGKEALTRLETIAHRVYELAGWHSELYVDSRELPDVEAHILTLPKVSIDHLGLYQDGLPHLLHLVEHGVYVKATGFGRVDLDIVRTLHTIYTINPGALLFGTDLPSPRAKRPFRTSDVAIITEALGEEAVQKVLYSNAMLLYKLHNPQIFINEDRTLDR